MNLKSGFIVLYLIIPLCNGGLVLTKLPDLKEYANILLSRTGYNSDMLLEAEIDYRFGKCLEIFTAKLFTIYKSTGYDDPVNDTVVTVAQLKTLKHKIEVEPCVPRYIHINKVTTRMWALQCFDYNLNFTWFPTYDENLGIGLLLKTVHPKLIALMDKSTRLRGLSEIELHSSVLESLNVTSNIHMNKLCDLKMASRIRLCSIVTEAMHKSSTDYIRRYEEDNNKNLIFPSPLGNFMYGIAGPICPKVIVNVKTQVFKIPALVCDTSIKQNFYRLYLTMNMKLSSGSVFVMILNPDIENNFNLEVKLVDEIPIPQMKNIFDIDSHFN